MSRTFDNMTLAERVETGWNYSRTLERKAHLPANVADARSLIVSLIVTQQGGTANTANVTAALDDQATIALALSTIQAL